MIGLKFLTIFNTRQPTKYIECRLLDYFRKKTLKCIVVQHVFIIKTHKA